MQTAVDVYRDCLRSLGHGYPLYEPNPAGEYDRVRIGDVGYVDNHGKFHRAFNTFYSADHGINREGVPEHFIPVKAAWQKTYFLDRHSPGEMHSSSVSASAASLDLSLNNLPAGMKFSFSCNQQQGASIALSGHADRENARSVAKLSEYMHQNYEHWLPFVRDNLGWDVNLRDLIFVTGVDIAKAWATVTFSHKENNAEAGFSFNDPTHVAGTAAASFTHSWRSSTNIAIRFGPNSSTSSGDTGSRTEETHQEKVHTGIGDQCIFLRGYRIIERKLLPSKLRAAAQPKSDNADRDNHATPKIRAVDFGLNNRVDPYSLYNEETEITRSCNIYEDLAELIFKGLSAARIAVVHDDDVTVFLKNPTVWALRSSARMMYCDGVPDAARYVSAYSSGCDTLKLAGLKRLGAYMDFLADDGRTLLQTDKCGITKEINEQECDTKSKHRRSLELEELHVDSYKVKRNNAGIIQEPRFNGLNSSSEPWNSRRSARTIVRMKRRRIEDQAPISEPTKVVNSLNRWNRGPRVLTGDGLRPEWRKWIGDAFICYNEDRYAMLGPAHGRHISSYIQ